MKSFLNYLNNCLSHIDHLINLAT